MFLSTSFSTKLNLLYFGQQATPQCRYFSQCRRVAGVSLYPLAGPGSSFTSIHVFGLSGLPHNSSSRDFCRQPARSRAPRRRRALQLDTANLGFPISEVRRNDKRFVTSNTFRINLNRQEGRTGQTMHINGGNNINSPKKTFSSGFLIVMSPVSRNIAR